MPEPHNNPYEPFIKRFVDAMRYKLRRNQSKGRWEDVNLEQALALLDGEVQELKEAAREGNYFEVLLEAADVANFCLIIFFVAMRTADRSE